MFPILKSYFPLIGVCPPQLAVYIHYYTFISHFVFSCYRRLSSTVYSVFAIIHLYHILYFPSKGVCPPQFTLYAEEHTCFHYAGLLSIPMGTDYCKNLNANLIAIQSERMQDFLASIVGRRYLDLCIFLFSSSITLTRINCSRLIKNGKRPFFKKIQIYSLYQFYIISKNKQR